MLLVGLDPSQSLGDLGKLFQLVVVPRNLRLSGGGMTRPQHQRRQQEPLRRQPFQNWIV